jgi:hypothetical protein
MNLIAVNPPRLPLTAVPAAVTKPLRRIEKSLALASTDTTQWLREVRLQVEKGSGVPASS